MPYIFVRSEMNKWNPQAVFGGSKTYIDFHLSFDQSRSHLYKELLKCGLSPVNEVGQGPHYSHTPGSSAALSGPAQRLVIEPTGSPGRKTYYASAPAYEVLNTLETCGYKVVAASSTPIDTQYMWTLQGPVDRVVHQQPPAFF